MIGSWKWKEHAKNCNLQEFFFFLVSKSSNAYMKWSLNYNFLRKEEIKGQLMTNATVSGMKSIQSAILVTIFWNFSMF